MDRFNDNTNDCKCSSLRYAHYFSNDDDEECTCFEGNYGHLNRDNF